MSQPSHTPAQPRAAAPSAAQDGQVLNYLKQHGYANAALLFEKERKVTLERKEEPRVFSEQYQKLRDYVSNSLDMYKVELEQLLFPIFVHCFLEMVHNNQSQAAAEFFKSYQHDHVFLYKQDVEVLQGLSTPAHLEENPQAKMYREHKFGLRMAEHTFHILRSFLHDNKLVLLLSIVNEHINIDVFAGDSESADQDTMVVGLTGYSDSSPIEQHQLNKSKIHWGALDTPAIATHRHEKTRAAQEAAADGAPAPKKAKAEVPTADSMNMSESKVPLPELTDAEWEQQLLELRAAVKVSSASLPSVCCYTMMNAADTMTSIEISRDASKVVMGTSESVVYMWDLQKLSSKKKPEDVKLDPNASGDWGPTVYVGHSGPVYSASLSPDARFLMTASEDKTARLWSLETNSCLVAYKGHNYPVWDLKFAPLGIYFATASHDRTARIWSCDQIHPLRILAGHLSDVDCVAWHPNCNYVATGSSDKTLRLWDIQSGQCVRLFTGAAMHCHGVYLASAGEDKSVMLWDLGSGRRVASYHGHTNTVWSLDFSLESTVLASGSADNTVRLWDVASGQKQGQDTSIHEPLKTLPTKSTPISLVRFSSRNVLLAAGVYNPPR